MLLQFFFNQFTIIKKYSQQKLVASQLFSRRYFKSVVFKYKTNLLGIEFYILILHDINNHNQNFKKNKNFA